MTKAPNQPKVSPRFTVTTRILGALPFGFAAFALAALKVQHYDAQFQTSSAPWIWGLVAAVLYYVAGLVGLRYCTGESIFFATFIGTAMVIAVSVLHFPLFLALAYAFPIGFALGGAVSGPEEEYQLAHPHERDNVY